MPETIHTVKRFISDREVTREELLSRKLRNPELDFLYRTVLKRLEDKTAVRTEK